MEASQLTDERKLRKRIQEEGPLPANRIIPTEDVPESNVLRMAIWRMLRNGEIHRTAGELIAWGPPSMRPLH